MINIKKFIFLFLLLFIISGCTDNNKDINARVIVNDSNIINEINNEISILQYLDSIKDGYKKKHIELKDISNNDRVKYGLLYKYKYNTSNNILVSEISKYIVSCFGTQSIDYKSINYCPSFKYNKANKEFLIDSDCKNNNDEIIYYIDEITNLNNEYYVNVYVGLLDRKNKKIYYSIIKDENYFDYTESFKIDNENKNSFTSYNYTFTKNSNGNYVFNRLNKN